MVRQIVAAAIVVFSATLVAQQPSVSAEVAAAHKRLEYFIGQWNVDGTGREAPGGKPQPFSGSLRCEWFEIGSQVICRGETTGGPFPGKELIILAYNAATHAYTRYSVDGTSGGSGYSTGTVTGKAWQWTLVYPKMPDVQVRASWTEVSPDAHTAAIEMSQDGNTYATLAEARVTRVK
jgi:Protein of unknown function (DUF1579)